MLIQSCQVVNFDQDLLFIVNVYNGLAGTVVNVDPDLPGSDC
jgi:hypothetical protein